VCLAIFLSRWMVILPNPEARIGEWKMKKFLTGSIVALATLSLAIGASAGVINTTDGAINSNPGTATYGEVATYVSGGGGLTGSGLTWPMDAGDGIGNVSQEASNVDRYWLNYNSSGVGAPGAGSIIYSLQNATSNVLAVAGIDHGPGPYESLEFIIWGQRADGTWEEGAITAIFDQGVDAAWAYDDFSSVWSFAGSYSTFAVSGGSHFLGTGQCLTCTEGEIDALAAYDNVPAPAALGFLGLGLAGLGVARRRRPA
jgi:hypothetical protein